MDSRLGASLAGNGFAVREAPVEEEAAALEDESAPMGPSADEETNYLAERQFAPTRIETVQPRDDEVAEGDNLPAMNALVERIPAEVLTMMDELFRAKFVTVQRVPKRALKR